MVLGFPCEMVFAISALSESTATAAAISSSDIEMQPATSITPARALVDTMRGDDDDQPEPLLPSRYEDAARTSAALPVDSRFDVLPAELDVDIIAPLSADVPPVVILPLIVPVLVGPEDIKADPDVSMVDAIKSKAEGEPRTSATKRTKVHNQSQR